MPYIHLNYILALLYATLLYAILLYDYMPALLYADFSLVWLHTP